MMLLEAVGMPAQKERRLRPIVEGRARSAFAMTEPAPGGGTDPAMIRTAARRVGDRYRIDGHKWFITDVEGAEHFATDAGRALVRRVPQRRLGRPEELDGQLLLLASGAGSFMTGSVLAVDGGHLVSSL